MNKKIVAVLRVIASVAVLTALYFTYDGLKNETEAINLNEETNQAVAAPDFTVLDTGGHHVNLSDFFGKPIVVNFWASWCPPCKLEMPDFNTVFLEMGGEINFMMVSLADGLRETVETAAMYVEAEGFSFPVFYDTERNAASAYGVSPIPTTYFINAKGEIVTYALGAIDENTLRAGIEMLIDQRSS